MTRRSKSRPPKPVKQSAAIVVRVTRHGRKILLVTARRSSKRWIFPKGRIERGESSAAAALREAEEEAGVVGDMVGRAGVLHIGSSDVPVRVEHFVIRLRSLHKAYEGRALRWCSVRKAIELLGHEEARKLLEKARPLLDRAADLDDEQ
jgi:8-oxo-dGTP pyrophosphatase MutT (NUDIX family)